MSSSEDEWVKASAKVDAPPQHPRLEEDPDDEWVTASAALHHAEEVRKCDEGVCGPPTPTGAPDGMPEDEMAGNAPDDAGSDDWVQASHEMEAERSPEAHRPVHQPPPPAPRFTFDPTGQVETKERKKDPAATKRARKGERLPPQSGQVTRGWIQGACESTPPSMIILLGPTHSVKTSPWGPGGRRGDHGGDSAIKFPGATRSFSRNPIPPQFN